MIFNEEIACLTVKYLLQIKAIKLCPNDPFTWVSGWKSPIYCDNKITLSYPSVRNFLRENLVKAIYEHYDKPNVIAGVATGAIAIGVLAAQQMGLPFIYVRLKAKNHGRKSQIECHLDSAQNVVVIEDLISTGSSSIKVVNTLRKAKANVLGMAAIFTYGFLIADQNFAQANCNLVTLSDYGHLIEQLNSQTCLDEDTASILKDWQKDPANWRV